MPRHHCNYTDEEDIVIQIDPHYKVWVMACDRWRCRIMDVKFCPYCGAKL